MDDLVADDLVAAEGEIGCTPQVRRGGTVSATVLYMSMSLDGLERTRILEGEAGVTHLRYGSNADVQGSPAAGGAAWLLSWPTSSGA
jgi:hypothetical protein